MIFLSIFFLLFIGEVCLLRLYCFNLTGESHSIL